MEQVFRFTIALISDSLLKREAGAKASFAGLRSLDLRLSPQERSWGQG